MRTFMLLSLLCLPLFSCKDDDGQATIIEFVGTKWEVLKILKDGDWQDAPDLYVLDFQSETQFTLNLDINAGGGKWEQPDEGKIHFFEMSFTEACCDSQFAIDMLEIFGTVEVYELDGQILTLGGDGKIVLKTI